MTVLPIREPERVCAGPSECPAPCELLLRRAELPRVYMREVDAVPVGTRYREGNVGQRGRVLGDHLSAGGHCLTDGSMAGVHTQRLHRYRRRHPELDAGDTGRCHRDATREHRSHHRNR
jgi:hypothetical protein